MKPDVTVCVYSIPTLPLAERVRLPAAAVWTSATLTLKFDVFHGYRREDTDTSSHRIF